MRRLTVSTVLCMLFVSALPAAARDTTIDVELLGGYTLVTAGKWDVRVDEYVGRRFGHEASDGSFLNPGPVAGIGLVFLPRSDFFHFRYGLEVLAEEMPGKVKGDWVSQAGELRRYDEDLLFQAGLLNMHLGCEFGNWAFRPYVYGGLGGILGIFEVSGDDLQDYGIAFHLVWGGDYHPLDWLTVGVQFRFADYLGLQYKWELDDQNTVLFKPALLPLQALAKVGFRF